MSQDKEKVKRIAQKVVDQGSSTLAILEDTTDIKDSIENVREELKTHIQEVSDKIKEPESVDLSPILNQISLLQDEIKKKDFQGPKGDSYSLTSTDKEEIASLAMMGIVIPEKIIERIETRFETQVEMPIVTQVAMYETGDEIINKINTSSLFIDSSRISGLDKKLRDLESMVANNALPITTTFVNGTRAKNLNFTGATVSYSGDTANIAITGGGSNVLLQTDGVSNTSQSVLNLIGGTNITLVPDAFGGVTINSTGSSPTANSWKYTVFVATFLNVNIASAPSSIDGISLTVGDRVLLWGQTSTPQNGIYDFNGTGVPLTRSSDSLTSNDIRGSTVRVESGANNSGRLISNTNTGTITVGVTNINYVYTIQGISPIVVDLFNTISLTGSGVTPGTYGGEFITNEFTVTASGTITNVVEHTLNGLLIHPIDAATLTGGTNTFQYDRVPVGLNASSSNNLNIGENLTSLTSGTKNIVYGINNATSLVDGTGIFAFGLQNLNAIISNTQFAVFGSSIFDFLERGDSNIGIGFDIGSNLGLMIDGSTIIGQNQLQGQDDVVNDSFIIGKNNANSDTMSIGEMYAFGTEISNGVATGKTVSTSFFFGKTLATDASSFNSTLIGEDMFRGEGVTLSEVIGIGTHQFYNKLSSPANFITLGFNNFLSELEFSPTDTLAIGSMIGNSLVSSVGTLMIGFGILQKAGSDSTTSNDLFFGNEINQGASYQGEHNIVFSALGFGSDNPMTYRNCMSFSVDEITTIESNLSVLLFNAEPSTPSSTNEVAFGNENNPYSQYWLGWGGLASGSPAGGRVILEPTESNAGGTGANFIVRGGNDTIGGNFLIQNYISGTPSTAAEFTPDTIFLNRHVEMTAGVGGVSAGASAGTATLSSGASDHAGKVTVSNTGVTVITITFATPFTNAPSAFSYNETTPTNLCQVVTVPGKITITVTTVSGDVITYGVIAS